MPILLPPPHPPAAARAARAGRPVPRRPRARRVARALAVGVYRGYLRDNAAGLAAQVAYSMVFAVPALLLCLTALALALGAGLVVGARGAGAAPGCRAFGQGLVAGEARDETPGVGEEASTFAPANDDVALFKALACG
jgi:hypothetical protein